MKRKVPWLLSVILGLIAILLSTKAITQNGNSSGNQKSGTERANSGKATPDSEIGRRSSTKRDRADAAYKKSLQEMEREFDKILPAQFPNQHSSLCDANLKPGENLIIGGFTHADGNFEFSSLILEEIEADGGTQHVVRMRTFTMSGECATELGLDPLVSPAKTRIQQSIVFPPGDLSWMRSAVDIMTAPSITIKPGQPGTMRVGTDQQALALSVITDPGSDGNSIRIRTRIESPVGTQNP